MFLNSPIFYTNEKEYVLFFISDESIWKLTAKNLECALKEEYNLNRLINVNSLIKNICISKDKKWLAFTCAFEGLYDIYVISTDGGELNRITNLNAQYINVLQIIEDEIIFASIHESVCVLSDKIFSIKFDAVHGCCKTDEGVIEKGLNADWYSTDGNKEVVQQDGYGYATWRKYQGGRTGKLWLKQYDVMNKVESTDDIIDNKINTEGYKKIIDVGFNAIRPCIYNGYVYFLTDMYGIGNVCRVKLDDQYDNIEQCTFETEHYVDQFYVNDAQIHYTAGGDLFIVDLKDAERAIEQNKRQLILQDKIFKTHLYNRSVRDSGDYKAKMLECMSGYHIKNDGKRIVCVIRGKVFEMPTYTSVGWNIGETNKYYSDAIYVNDKMLLIEIGKQESIVILDTEENNRAVCMKIEHDFGHITEVNVNNNGEYAAVLNNRAQLLLVNLKTGNVKELIPAEYYISRSVNWSTNGRYLAYTNKVQEKSSQAIQAIFIYDTKTEQAHQITEGLYGDMNPVFDHSGKYLYFLSNRNVKPESDSIRVMLHFEDIASPFVIALQTDVSDPFLNIDDEEEKEKEEDKEEKHEGTKEAVVADIATTTTVEDATATEIKTVEPDKSETAEKSTKDTKEAAEKTDLDIDFENIMYRCYALPNVHSGYVGMEMLNKELLLYDMSETLGCMNVGKYNFSLQKYTEYLQNVSSMVFSTNHEHFLYISDNAMKIGEAGEAVWKKNGVIDWSRINLNLKPIEEFIAIFDQAWFLAKETFAYTGNKPINWDGLYDKYLDVVRKVSNRDELNHVILYMQGELESSHSYLLKTGDTKKRTIQTQGYLGAELRYDELADGYIIDRIFRGNVWSENVMHKGPLYDCKIGDVITHINGVKLNKNIRPEHVLRNMALKIVQLKIKSVEKDKDAKSKNIVKYVRLLMNESGVRYLDWVQSKKNIVQEKCAEIGYIHIPDMGESGYEYFVKAYLAQYTKKGLIIDVRNNMGGYVGTMILDMLRRQRVGAMCSKFGGSDDPYETCAGKLIFLIDAGTSSDGDGFAYMVKKLKLGKTIGMRTWGGVIGIMPRYELLDGGKIAIPEFPTYLLQLKDKNKKVLNEQIEKSCKCDVEKLECCSDCYQTCDGLTNVLQVENYGVMPDVIVEHSPDQKIDMQLQTAIDMLMQEI